MSHLVSHLRQYEIYSLHYILILYDFLNFVKELSEINNKCSSDLDILNNTNIISFSKTLRKPEGKKGVVVTLLASLELAKDGYIELIQNKSEELFIKSVRGI